MPGYRQGFMDAIVVFLDAANWFKRDLSMLVQYMECCQDKLEQSRSEEIQKELNLWFPEFEKQTDEQMYAAHLKETASTP